MWSALRRIAFSGFVLFVVSLLLFFLTRAIPVSPARIVLGADATEEQIEVFDRGLGLDRPVLVQYAGWISDILRGELGNSYITNRPLGQQIAQSFPITLELVCLAFAFALLTAIPLGILSALKAGRAVDHAARLFAVIGVSIPGFWLGLLLIVQLAVPTGLFPPGGYVPLARGLGAHLNSLILPAFTLGIHYVAVLSRLTRSSMLDALSQDYIRTARAMGLPAPRIWLYAFKNAAAPVVGVAAMSFGYCFGWALIIEQVFNIAGLSRALLTGIRERDYPLIQLITLIITAIFIAANLAADLLNRALNPRLAVAAR
jgi:peptide/nickel transport system permease protein